MDYYCEHFLAQEATGEWVEARDYIALNEHGRLCEVGGDELEYRQVQVEGKVFPYYEGPSGRFYQDAGRVKEIPEQLSPHDHFRSENPHLGQPKFGLPEIADLGPSGPSADRFEVPKLNQIPILPQDQIPV